MADLTREDVVDYIKNKVSLESANLSGMDLGGIDFSKVNLSRADLTECRLAGSRFSEANLSHVKASEADFGGCNLSGANLSHADFHKASLLEANLEGALGLDPSLLHGNAGEPESVEPIQRGLKGVALGVALHPAVDYNAPRPLGGLAEGKKASKYHPPLRSIPAVIFTTGGWIRGIFHIPVMHGFLEHINLAGEMLRLTQVTLPYLNLELRFFGLKRNKALLILPDCDPKLLRLPESTADFHVHRVSFLLEGGTITGSLAIEEDIRVSDYLANHDKFALLRNCRFGAHETPVEEESHFPLVLVNCNAVVGASDERLRK